ANSSQTHQTARGLRRCQKKRFKLTASVTTDKRPNPAFCRAHSGKRKLIPTIVELLYIGREAKPNLRPMKLSRSQFLKVVGTGALSLPAISACSSAASDHPAPAEAHSLDFGLASYALRKFDLDGVIQISKRLQLNSIALKSMHMPLDASPESLKEAAEKVRNAGLNLYGAGVIYMKTQEEVQSAFEYANTL